MFNVNAAVRWTARAPRVPRMPRAPRAPIGSALIRMAHYQLAADSSHDSPRTGCSPFPRPRRWALALRPEHHPRSDQSGHVEQPACRTRCPKEPHAQRSWHLQRSLPAQSEDLRTEVWLAESLRRRGARPTPRSHWLADELLVCSHKVAIVRGAARLKAGGSWRLRGTTHGRK